MTTNQTKGLRKLLQVVRHRKRMKDAIADMCRESGYEPTRQELDAAIYGTKQKQRKR